MMVVGTFMVMLDTTVVNVALPTIMNDLNATLGRAQLVVSTYLLAIARVIPLTGFLADELGAAPLHDVHHRFHPHIVSVRAGLGHQFPH